MECDVEGGGFGDLSFDSELEEMAAMLALPEFDTRTAAGEKDKENMVDEPFGNMHASRTITTGIGMEAAAENGARPMAINPVIETGNGIVDTDLLLRNSTTSSSSNSIPAVQSAGDVVEAPKGKKTGSQKAKDDGMGVKKGDSTERNRMNQKRFRERRKARLVGLEYSVQQLQEEARQLCLDNKSLCNRNQMLSAMVKSTDEVVMEVLKEAAQVSQQAKTVNGLDNNPVARAVVQEALSNQGFSTEAVMHMSPDDVVKQYKGRVQKLSELLLRLERTGDEEAKQEINDRMKEMQEIIIKVMILDPDIMKKFMQRNLENPEDMDAPTESEIRQSTARLKDTLNLTRSQCGQLLGLYQQSQKTFASIVAKQSRLAAQLEELCPKQALPSTYCNDRLKQVRRLTEEMKETADSKWQEWINFVIVFYKEIIDPVQCARLAVHSYPYAPDVLSLTLLVVEEEEKRQKEACDSDPYTWMTCGCYAPAS